MFQLRIKMAWMVGLELKVGFSSLTLQEVKKRFFDGREVATKVCYFK